jgi:negative regulator of flagellin synthesis FlgM
MMISNVKTSVADALRQFMGSEGMRNDADWPVTGTAVSGITEKVELSSRGKDIGQIRAVLTNTPDIREDKVMALKRDVENGKYRIQPEVVAKKMIDESLIDIFA